MVQGQLTKSRQHSRRHVQRNEKSSIQSKGVIVPFRTYPKKTFLLCHFERSEKSPPFIFRVEFEEGLFTSSI